MKRSKREIARIHQELRARIGRQLSEIRTDAGVSRAELARCAGIDPAHVLRIEAGTATPSLRALVALADCLGSEVGIRLFPIARPRLRDRFQAPMVEALLRELGPAWRSRPEVPVPAARGVIDVVLTRALDQLTIACECQSEMRRLEQVLRRAHAKAEALRESGAQPGTLSTVLLLRSTVDTRALARSFASTLAAAYPARVVDALAALRGSSAWPGPAIIWARVDGGTATILDGPPRGLSVGR
jgi:transcriptional regulator with XRE-family HTH domain